MHFLREPRKLRDKSPHGSDSTATRSGSDRFTYESNPSKQSGERRTEKSMSKKHRNLTHFTQRCERSHSVCVKRHWIQIKGQLLKLKVLHHLECDRARRALVRPYRSEVVSPLGPPEAAPPRRTAAEVDSCALLHNQHNRERERALCTTRQTQRVRRRGKSWVCVRTCARSLPPPPVCVSVSAGVRVSERVRVCLNVCLCANLCALFSEVECTWESC